MGDSNKTAKPNGLRICFLRRKPSLRARPDGPSAQRHRTFRLTEISSRLLGEGVPIVGVATGAAGSTHMMTEKRPASTPVSLAGTIRWSPARLQQPSLSMLLGRRGERVVTGRRGPRDLRGGHDEIAGKSCGGIANWHRGVSVAPHHFEGHLAGNRIRAAPKNELLRV